MPSPAATAAQVGPPRIATPAAPPGGNDPTSVPATSPDGRSVSPPRCRGSSGGGGGGGGASSSRDGDSAG
eukprot:311957-Chlamydomonas_euryale.AAC.4